MTVSVILSKKGYDVVTVDPGDTIEFVAQLLSEKKNRRSDCQPGQRQG